MNVRFGSVPVDARYFHVIDERMVPVIGHGTPLAHLERGHALGSPALLGFLLVQDGTYRVLPPVDRRGLEGSLAFRRVVLESPGTEIVVLLLLRFSLVGFVVTVAVAVVVVPFESGFRLLVHRFQGYEDAVPDFVQIVRSQPG